MTNDPTSAAIRKQINTMLKEQIEITRDGWWHPKLGYSELVDAIEQAIVEAETRGRRGLLEYFDQVPSNDLMDWKGLFADVRAQLDYEEKQANADGANGRDGEDK